jgi:transposase-like protein
VFLHINGELHYLCRAVDQHEVLLDILVQDPRNARAAKRFFKRLLVGLKCRPRRIITCAAMVLLIVKFFQRCGIAPAGISTTDLRIRTGRHAGGNGRCNGSSHPSKPSASCQRTR